MLDPEILLSEEEMGAQRKELSNVIQKIRGCWKQTHARAASRAPGSVAPR